MIEISEVNRRAIDALPKKLQGILEEDINDAIGNRVKVLQLAV
jgi:hypothetical protein